MMDIRDYRLIQFITITESETEWAGAVLGRAVLEYGKPCYIALDGDMGAGKTAFVRGLASVLSPGSRVKSPTYTIVNEYRKGVLPLFHFDLYRISDAEDELYGIGFEDYLAEGVCVAEWSSILGDDLPKDAVTVQINKSSGECGRHIKVCVPEGFPSLSAEEDNADTIS